MADGHFFKCFAGDEVGAPGRDPWKDQEFGWYFLLKAKAWISPKRGTLPFPDSALADSARAQLKTPALKKRWQTFLDSLDRDEDGFVVFPDLVTNAREMKSQSNHASNSAKIGVLLRDLEKARTSKDTEAVKVIEQKLAKLRGVKSAPAADAPKKSAKTRGHTGHGGESTVKDGQKSEDGEKVAWNGTFYWPSQLEKNLKDTESQLKTLKKSRDSYDSTEYNKHLASLLEKISSLKSVLGYSVTPPPSASPSPRSVQPAKSPGQEQCFELLNKLEVSMGSIQMRLAIGGLTVKELKLKILEADQVVKHLENPPNAHLGAYRDREGNDLPHIAQKLARWRSRRAELLNLAKTKTTGRIIVPQPEGKS